jgi:hypothetical protein
MDVLGRYSSLPIAHQQAPKKRGRKKKEGDRGKMKDISKLVGQRPKKAFTHVSILLSWGIYNIIIVTISSSK